MKEATLANMRKVVVRADAAGAANVDALAAVSAQMAELRESYLGWQQTVLAGRLDSLKADSRRIAETDRLKVRPQALPAATTPLTCSVVFFVPDSIDHQFLRLKLAAVSAACADDKHGLVICAV